MMLILLYLFADFVISDAQNEQIAPNVCKGDNLWFVVWEDERTGDADIWAQFVDFNFTLVGGDFSIYTGTFPQSTPVASFLINKYLVVWRHCTPSWNYHIYGQLVDNNGSLIGSFIIIEDVANAENPAIAAGEDKWIVVWNDYRNGNLDIYAQLIDRNGNLIGGNFPICQAAGEQISPYPSWNGKNWLIVWEDRRSGESDIYAQIIDGIGTPIGSNFLICGAPNYQRYPKVGSNKSSWMVVWADFRNNVKYEIYGRFVDSLGNLIGTDFLIASVNNAYYPQVLWDGQKWLIIWSDDAPGITKILCQTVNFMGIPQGSPIRVSNSPNRGWYSSFSIHDDKYFAVWQDDRNGVWDIYGNGFIPASVEEINIIRLKDYKIEIFDICGKRVSEPLNNGIYFLKIKDENNKILQCKKIILIR